MPETRQGQTVWVDRIARVIIFIIFAIIAGLCVAAALRALREEEMFGLVLLMTGLIALGLTGSHNLPLKITDEAIYLASEKFPSVGRKPVKFKEIKDLFVDNCRRFDEGGEERSGKFLLVVRVTDIHGKKFRNILFSHSLQDFRKVIATRLDEKIIRGHGKATKEKL